MAWRYHDELMGNSCHVYVMEGDRVVCRLALHGITMRSPGEDVERMRREFRSIVAQHNELERLRKHIVLLEANLGSAVAVELSRQESPQLPHQRKE
jgi:hypothetical protein